MRTSRRTSHISAALARPARVGVATAGALAVAAALAGCSSSASTPGQTGGNTPQLKPADDLQLLSALQVNPAQLDSAFTDTGWQAWNPTDAQKAKIGLTAFLSCTLGGISQDGKSVDPVTNFFSNDTAATPTSPATTTGGKKGTTPPPTGDNAQVPAQWAGSVAVIYKDAAHAQQAAKTMGRLDKKNKACGSPTMIGKPGITYFGGSVESNPAWYGGNSVVVFVDTKENSTMSAIAQQRGRFVIVTYTRGSSLPESGYYTLNSTQDSVYAAAAATQLLSQLTNAVVGDS